MKLFNENLSLSQEITIVSELLKEDLSYKDLALIYFFLKTYSQTIEPRSAIRLKSLLNRVSKLVSRKRHAQSIKTEIPMAERYLQGLI